MKEMETMYQGLCEAVMIADRDISTAEHFRSSKKRSSFPELKKIMTQYPIYMYLPISMYTYSFS